MTKAGGNSHSQRRYLTSLKPRVRYQHSEREKKSNIFFSLLSLWFIWLEFFTFTVFLKKITSRLELREVTSPSDPSYFCSQRSSTHFTPCLEQGAAGWLPYPLVLFPHILAGLRLTHLHTVLPKPCALETAPSWPKLAADTSNTCLSCLQVSAFVTFPLPCFSLQLLRVRDLPFGF